MDQTQSVVRFYTATKLGMTFTFLKVCKREKKRKKQRTICDNDCVRPAKPKIFTVQPL